MNNPHSHSYRKYLTLGIFSLASLTLLIAGALYADGPSILYTRCSGEGGTCILNGSTKISYGANGTFSEITVDAGTLSIRCTNSVFGGDPLSGVLKACYKKNVVATVILSNLPWGREEKKENGFLVLAGQTKQIKDIYTNPECKIVGSSGGLNVFIPTGRSADWEAFKTNAPNNNIGVKISNCQAVVGYSWRIGSWGSCNAECGVSTVQYRPVECMEIISASPRVYGNVVSDIYCSSMAKPVDNQGCTGTLNCPYPTDGKCSTSPGLCDIGLLGYDNGLTTGGTTRIWTCMGLNGGNTPTCSYLNTVMVSCGNGIREGSEVCDNGLANNNSTVGACKTDCSGIVLAPSASITGPSQQCVYFGPSTYYKINYYTQTNPASGLINDQTYNVPGIGNASFQGYVGGNASWAQPVSPMTAYTTSSCTPVSAPINSCASPDPSFANIGILTRNPTSPNQSWSYSTSGGSCSYTCINGYSGNGCGTAPVPSCYSFTYYQQPGNVDRESPDYTTLSACNSGRSSLPIFSAGKTYNNPTACRSTCSGGGPLPVATVNHGTFSSNMTCGAGYCNRAAWNDLSTKLYELSAQGVDVGNTRDIISNWWGNNSMCQFDMPTYSTSGTSGVVSYSARMEGAGDIIRTTYTINNHQCDITLGITW